MANRLSRNAPYEIASIDIHSLNDVFRQIQQAIDELRGLNGAVTIFDTITFDEDQFVTTEIADVAATESAGTSEKLARGDHVHAHGTGYLPNAHHNQAHAIDGADHTGNLDASAITYTPADLTDWSGSSDPGNTDDALDQLADRVTTVEAGGSNAESDFTEGADNTLPWEAIQSNEDTLRVDAHAQGNAVELRALQPITMGGDPEVTFAQFLTDDDGNVIYG